MENFVIKAGSVNVPIPKSFDITSKYRCAQTNQSVSINKLLVFSPFSNTDHTNIHSDHPVDGITDIGKLLLVKQRVDGEAHDR